MGFVGQTGASCTTLDFNGGDTLGSPIGKRIEQRKQPSRSAAGRGRR